MNNNKIAPALARVMPARANPAGNAGANQAQRQMAAVRPVAPIQVANGQMPANGNVAPASVPQQTSSVSSTPAVILQSRTMGGQTYKRDADKLTQGDVKMMMPSELLPMLGDGSKVSFHRVHDDVLSAQGTSAFHFIGHDPNDKGRALVSVNGSKGQRRAYEVTFHFKALPLLAKEAHKSPKL